jgi:hypothetical protein
LITKCSGEYDGHKSKELTRKCKNLHEELQSVNVSFNFVKVIKQNVDVSATCCKDGGKKFIPKGEISWKEIILEAWE